VDDEIAELRKELERVRGLLPDRINVDPEGVEQGLAKLVLTLVEFLRQLLERQAIRRMDGGTLTDDEIERVGVALMRLVTPFGSLAIERAVPLRPQLGDNPRGRFHVSFAARAQF
jgi:hypothetical protein